MANENAAFTALGNVIATGNKAGATPTITTTTEESTNESGDKVVTTTKTTVVYGATGAIHTNGLVRISGDATLSGNTAATNGALYSGRGTQVGGALTMANNVANGATTVETTTVTTKYAEDGSVAEETTSTTTETTYANGRYGAAYVGQILEVGGDATFTGNKSTGDVGAVSANAMTVTGALVANENVADGKIGAIEARVNGGTVGELTVGGDAKFIGNKSGDDFGAANVESMRVKGSLLATDNTSGGNVGAIATAKYLRVEGSSATFSDNKASESFGAVAHSRSRAISRRRITKRRTAKLARWASATTSRSAVLRLFPAIARTGTTARSRSDTS